jgi:hypothetical protein
LSSMGSSAGGSSGAGKAGLASVAMGCGGGGEDDGELGF